MYINRIKLSHFRSYEELDLSINGPINCFFGANGMGKTNLLEAIHLIGTTKGFSSDKNLIQSGEKFFTVETEFNNNQSVENNLDKKIYLKNELPGSIKCSYMPNRGKKIFYDGVPVEKFSEHIGKLPVVAILPQDIDLILGTGTDRRFWLDGLLSQFDRSYLESLIKYDRCLKQRNAVLQNFLERNIFDIDQLTIWDVPMAEAGAIICQKRLEFFNDFEPYFHEFYRKLIPTQEVPKLKYDSIWKGLSIAEWLGHFEYYRNRDRFSGKTQYGTHKDDLIFEVQEKSVRYFGSQGQQKTFIVALKLAQFDYLTKKTGKKPIIILDDVFDKLDEFRVSQLADIVSNQTGGQVFISDTSFFRLQNAFRERKNSDICYYNVTNSIVNEYKD